MRVGRSLQRAVAGVVIPMARTRRETKVEQQKAVAALTPTSAAIMATWVIEFMIIASQTGLKRILHLRRTY